MSISLLPARIFEEIRAQRRARDERLEGAAELLERYPGAFWCGPPGAESPFDSENASFEYMSQAMSQLVWTNPRWRVTTARPRAQQMVAEAMHHGMNRWTTDSDFKTVLEDAAVDYSFSWAVMHVSPQPRPDSYEAEDPILWPQASRLSPWEFGFDNRAPTWRRARMLWHEYWLDRDDLIRRAKEDRKRPREQREGWILEAVEALVSSQRERDKRSTGSGEIGPERDEVKLIDVYLPGHREPGAPGPEDGFHGTRLTLGTTTHGTGGDYLKPPQAFFGPRWGPYTVFGNYIVPDSPYPLSLLMAAAGHIVQSSRLSAAVDRQVQQYKRMLLVAAGQPQLAKMIKDGKNDAVHSLPQVADLERFVREYEIGGTNQHNIAAEMRSIDKRNRIMGMDEVQRGNVTGEGTATEVQLAVEAALGRQGFVKGRFQDGVRRVGKTVAWYLYHMDEIVFPLGPDAFEALGMNPDEEQWFMGGDHGEGMGTTFDDLGLEIEPYSMERPSEAFLRQRGELIGNVLMMVPALAQAAQVGADVKGLLDSYGDAFGMPNLSRLFPGMESMDPGMIQPMHAQPRLSKDVGRMGLVGGGGMRAGRGAPQPSAFAGAG